MTGLILSFIGGVFFAVTAWAVCEVRSIENWNR
jgi:hypothetical protein